jgi:hypothetical protein
MAPFRKQDPWLPWNLWMAKSINQVNFLALAHDIIEDTPTSNLSKNINTTKNLSNRK